MFKIASTLLIVTSLLFTGSVFANNDPYQDENIDTNEYQVSQIKPMSRYDYVPVYQERLKTFNELLKNKVYHKKITLEGIQCLDVDEGMECGDYKVVTKIEFDLSYVFLNEKRAAGFQKWNVMNDAGQDAFHYTIETALHAWLTVHGLPIDSSRNHVFALTKEAREWYKEAPFYVIGLQPTKVEYATYKYTEPGLTRQDDANQYSINPL